MSRLKKLKTCIFLVSYSFFIGKAFGSTQKKTKSLLETNKIHKQSTVKSSLKKLPSKNIFPIISMHYIEESINSAAQKVGIPSELLKAICQVESNLKPHAFVAQDGGSQNHAFGICQVLRKTADALLGADPGCQTNFSLAKIPRTYENCKLFGPKTNALAAAMYLKYQIDRYNGNLLKATAAYNSGKVKICTTGIVKNQAGKTLYKCQKGGLLNEIYINKVASQLPENYFIKNSFFAQTAALIN